MSSTPFEDQPRRADRWLRSVNNLPPFPAVVLEAMALLDSRRSSARDVANVIAQDQAITAKLLRMVNSAFYRTSGQVTTVSHAVTLLGFEQLRILIVGVSLLEQSRAREPLAERARKALWEHSSACSRWAHALANATRYQPAEEAAVAGLLHDVGKVVLFMSGPREFSEAGTLSQREGIASYEAEHRAMGISHVETGKMVVNRWNLPTPVYHAVAFHHSPWGMDVDFEEMEESDASKLTHLLAIVRVANEAAKHSLAERTPGADPKDTHVAIGPEELLQRVMEVNSLLVDQNR